MGTEAIEQLNTACFCVTVDGEALRRELDSVAATRGLYAGWPGATRCW